MKKTYETPTIEISTIILEDIIASSGVSIETSGDGVFEIFDNLFN